jgi:hypothetical protein
MLFDAWNLVFALISPENILPLPSSPLFRGGKDGGLRRNGDEVEL